MSSHVQLSWCVDVGAVDELAAFFARNITSSYISHSELMFGRAIAVDQWSPDLQAILRREIGERIGASGLSDKRVAAAYLAGDLVGLAFVEFNTEVPIPFVLVEDIAIAHALRGKQLGQSFMDWIFASAREQGIKRAFLESGKDNRDAHHFFERNGFHQVSIVMMAELA